MAEAIEGGKCGLSISSISINDSRHFGPNRFRAESATVSCDNMTCTLKEGIAIKFAPISGETEQELQRTLGIESRMPDSAIQKQISQAIINNCPIYLGFTNSKAS